MFKKALIYFLLLVFAGCATVQGPEVSKEEIKQAKEEFETKALDFRIGQVKRINAIGYHLVAHIPREDITVHSRPFIGLFMINKDKKSERLFGGEAEYGVYVAFVLDDTPAARAGIQKGDIVTTINGKPVRSTRHVINRIDDLKSAEEAMISIVRGTEPMDVAVTVEELPIDVRFTVYDMQQVNAAATTDEIMVTYGLINFAKSDDEIAAVIGHELGHLARKHVNRKVGSHLITDILAIGVGLAVEAAAPGAGGAASRGVLGVGGLFNNKFSRDLEREADYFGLKFIMAAGYDPEVAATFHERFAIEIPSSIVSNYLSTHPSSPERTLRLRKAIEELNQEEAEDKAQEKK